MLAKHLVIRVAPVQTSPGERRRREEAVEESSNTQVGAVPDELMDWEATVTDDLEY